LPRQDHVWITTDKFSRYHKKEIDEMLCKLDSTEYARSSLKVKKKPGKSSSMQAASEQKKPVKIL